MIPTDCRMGRTSLLSWGLVGIAAIKVDRCIIHQWTPFPPSTPLPRNSCLPEFCQYQKFFNYAPPTVQSLNYFDPVKTVHFRHSNISRHQPLQKAKIQTCNGVVFFGSHFNRRPHFVYRCGCEIMYFLKAGEIIVEEQRKDFHWVTVPCLAYIDRVPAWLEKKVGHCTFLLLHRQYSIPALGKLFDLSDPHLKTMEMICCRR